MLQRFYAFMKPDGIEYVLTATLSAVTITPTHPVLQGARAGV